MVGWCEGVVYLTSPGRPIDIGLQLGKLAILVASKGGRGMFSVSSVLFLFLFLPCPSLSSLLLSLLSLFFLSL